MHVDSIGVTHHDPCIILVMLIYVHAVAQTLLCALLCTWFACPTHPGQVSFYMRKGADLLSKWVGEAEKQLRLLFEEASKHQPAIIFFDEIDGLAPVRVIEGWWKVTRHGIRIPHMFVCLCFRVLVLLCTAWAGLPACCDHFGCRCDHNHHDHMWPCICKSA